MREDLLHFVWKHRKLPLNGLQTSAGEALQIHDTGTHNPYSGPDFFNARISIDGQLWAGNVEIHVKASDWYQHRHEAYGNYNNVVLHVVWEDDIPVFRGDQSRIPALELRNIVPRPLLMRYRKLFEYQRRRFINCEGDIAETDPFLIMQWLERLYFERLERKSVEIDAALASSNNDWEQVFFARLLKNFGLNINGEAFHQIGQAVDFSIVRRIGDNVVRLESLLFGVSGLLEQEGCTDRYFHELREEFAYLGRLHPLIKKGVRTPEFARLRPANFPTIRLSQFAVLYATRQHLFSKAMAAPGFSESNASSGCGAAPIGKSTIPLGNLPQIGSNSSAGTSSTCC